MTGGRPGIVDMCLEEADLCGALAAEILVKESQSREAILPAERTGESHERGISLRVFLPGGRAAFGALTSCGETDGGDRVRAFVRRTASSAVRCDPSPLPELPGGDAPEGRGLGLYDPDIDLPASALMETAREVQGAIADAMASSEVEMKMQGVVSTVSLHNTSGFSGSYRQTMARMDLTLGGRIDGRSSATRVVRAARSLRGLAPDAVATEAAGLLEERLAPRVPPSGIHPVILAPAAAAELVAALSAWLCRGGWAGGESLEGSSMPRRGERVASKQVHLHDDGRLPGGIATAPFDGEGTPTSKTAVVDHGIVVDVLRDLAAGAEGAGSTGNGIRGSFREPPRLAPSNMFISPGSTSPVELLASVKQGVRITALGRVPPLDSPDTPFSIPFTGRWIHDGKLEAPLGGGYLAGTLRELLTEVKTIGSDFTFTHRRGSFGSPSLLLARAPVRSS